MRLPFRIGRHTIELDLPDRTVPYHSAFPEPQGSAAELVMRAVTEPVGAEPLDRALRERASGDVVVVLSDITRPVPYRGFLADLLGLLETSGVRRSNILLLVATGMHRPCTDAELREMLGDVAAKYRVLNHDPTDESQLAALPGKSKAGAAVRINRQYVEASFRILTGLVEPHFMAGFSGGRKAICPGLASLDTIRRFHGAQFMADANTRNARLVGNACHEEALSIARLASADFCLNIVMDARRRTVRAFAGGMEAAHAEACRFVRQCACPTVQEPADLVVTSSGGYPLDATFYQCIKGFVSCLPAVRQDGTVLAFGACSEGVGSEEYQGLMKQYSGRWQDFLEEVHNANFWVKDQWQLQMHCRALCKVGRQNLHFLATDLPRRQLAQLSVTGHTPRHRSLAVSAQTLLDDLLEPDIRVAAIPEGPYCAPLAGECGNTQK